MGKKKYIWLASDEDGDGTVVETYSNGQVYENWELCFMEGDEYIQGVTGSSRWPSSYHLKVIEIDIETFCACATTSLK